VNGQSRIFGMTALTKAAFHGDILLARALLERGAEVDLTENSGASALWIAVDWQHPDVVALLAEDGADLTVIPKAPHDVSALYQASEKESRNRENITCSADPSWSNSVGTTPLMNAALVR
jgi:hypothetical protein